MSQLTWLGHAAFRITKDSTCIYIDPWIQGNPKCPPELQDLSKHNPTAILVTHGHAGE